VISVILPFRDAERFLEESIESVLAQSYGNWELFLIDDGSTDGSSAIARRRAAADPERVFVLEHARHGHRGASASRNAGLARARGEFVAFLDADDVWHPRKLEDHVEIASTHPGADLVYGTRELWTNWEGPDRHVRGSIVPHGIEGDLLYAPPELFLLLFGSRVATVPSCSDLFVRRAAAVRVGGFEDAFRGMYDDQAFLVKICLEASVFVSSRSWTRYRQHPESCVARWAREDGKSGEWTSFLSWMSGYVSKASVGPAVRRAVRRAARSQRHPAFSRLLELPARLARRRLPQSPGRLEAKP
jgi:glycosyltransferase involved in cell wall biosynthesis